MKNGKAKAWPESSRLLVKMIEMEEVYHSATSPTVGGSVPHRSQSYRMVGAGHSTTLVAAQRCWYTTPRDLRVLLAGWHHRTVSANQLTCSTISTRKKVVTSASASPPAAAAS